MIEFRKGFEKSLRFVTEINKPKHDITDEVKRTLLSTLEENKFRTPDDGRLKFSNEEVELLLNQISVSELTITEKKGDPFVISGLAQYGPLSYAFSVKPF